MLQFYLRRYFTVWGSFLTIVSVSSSVWKKQRCVTQPFAVVLTVTKTEQKLEALNRSKIFHTLKPDFHSHFSPITSVIFAWDMCKVVHRIESDEGIPFASFAFEVPMFQLLQNFLATKPVRPLPEVTFIVIKEFLK